MTREQTWMVTVTSVRVVSLTVEAPDWEEAQVRGMALHGDEDNMPPPDSMNTSIHVERVT